MLFSLLTIKFVSQCHQYLKRLLPKRQWNLLWQKLFYSIYHFPFLSIGDYFSLDPKDYWYFLHTFVERFFRWNFSFRRSFGKRRRNSDFKIVIFWLDMKGLRPPVLKNIYLRMYLCNRSDLSLDVLLFEKAKEIGILTSFLSIQIWGDLELLWGENIWKIRSIKIM